MPTQPGSLGGVSTTKTWGKSYASPAIRLPRAREEEVLDLETASYQARSRSRLGTCGCVPNTVLGFFRSKSTAPDGGKNHHIVIHHQSCRRRAADERRTYLCRSWKPCRSEVVEQGLSPDVGPQNWLPLLACAPQVAALPGRMIESRADPRS